MKINKIIISVTTAMLLVGCGSSGGSTGTDTSEGTGSDFVSGKANGSVIKGAQYCVDKNKNNICEPTEPLSSFSNENGFFTFLKSEVEKGDILLSIENIFKESQASYGLRYGNLYKLRQSKILGDLEEVQNVSALSTLEKELVNNLNYDKSEVISFLNDNYDLNLEEEDLNKELLSDKKLELASIFSSSLINHMEVNGKDISLANLETEKINLNKIKLAVNKMISDEDDKAIEATAKIFEWISSKSDSMTLIEGYNNDTDTDLSLKFEEITNATNETEISDLGFVSEIPDDKYVDEDNLIITGYPEYTSDIKSIHIEDLFEITPEITNISGKEATFYSDNLPEWLTLNSVTGKLSGIPNAVIDSQEIIINSKIEGYASKIVADFSFKIVDNWAPVLNNPTLSKVSFLENEDVYSNTFVATDADGDTISYVLLKGAEELDWVNINEQTGELTIHPSPLHVGEYSFSLRVSDGKEEIIEDYTIEVENVNDLPSDLEQEAIDNWGTSVVETQLYEQEFSIYDLDGSYGDTLQFSLGENSPDWLSIEEMSIEDATSSEGLDYKIWNMKITGTPPAIEEVGVISGITLNVEDSSETNKVLHTFDLEVLKAFQFETNPETNHVYQIALNDTLNLPFGYTNNTEEELVLTVSPTAAWYEVQQSNDTISIRGVAAEWPANPTTLHNIIITLSNQEGSIIEETNPFTIEIYSPNSIPSWDDNGSNPYKIIGENENYLYQMLASDDDGDSITYSLENSPNWLTISPTGLLQGIAPAYDSQAETSTVTVTANDGSDQIEYSFDLSVKTGHDWDGDYIPNIIEDIVGLSSQRTNEDGDAEQTKDGIDSELEIDGVERGDLFFLNQWHMHSEIESSANILSTEATAPTTTAGNDLNIPELWGQGVFGYNILHGIPKSINVQIVGEAFEATHPDLISDSGDSNPISEYSNVDLISSYNYTTASYGEIVDPDPDKGIAFTISPVATQQAGIIAAKGWNGKGIRGIMPMAKVSNYNLFNGQDLTEPATILDWQRAFYIVDKDNIVDGGSLTEGDVANDIDVSVLTSNYNCSGLNLGALTSYIDLAAFGDGASNLPLRNGKGRVVVVPAGNSRLECNGVTGSSDSSLNSLTNSYSTIAVAGVSTNHSELETSTMGGTVYISGYSSSHWKDQPGISSIMYEGRGETKSSIPTSGDTWWENKFPTYDDLKAVNYTFGAYGSEAATAVVGGVLGLVLDACPNITYRDVRHLVQKHAKNDIGVPADWTENNVGVKYSNKFGFGLIQPVEIITECASGSYVNIGSKIEEENISINNTPTNIEAGNTLSNIITMSSSGVNDFIQFGLKLDSGVASELMIKLTSPSGTQVVILENGKNISDNFFEGSIFKIGNLNFLGEESQGDWSYEIINKGLITAVIRDVSLTSISH